MNKKIIVITYCFLFLAISLGFQKKDNEIYLLSMEETDSYGNKYNYEFLLDTMKSQINVYEHCYGQEQFLYPIFINPDSSLQYLNRFREVTILTIKNGLIQKLRMPDLYYHQSYIYDNNSHLIRINPIKEVPDDSDNCYPLSPVLLSWEGNQLIEIKDSNKRCENLDGTITSKLVPEGAVKSGIPPRSIFALFDYDEYHNPLLVELGLYGKMSIPDACMIFQQSGEEEQKFVNKIKI